MNKETVMKKIAEEIKEERIDTTIVGPEAVRSSKVIDIESILTSNLGSEKALMDNGEILRNF